MTNSRNQMEMAKTLLTKGYKWIIVICLIYFLWVGIVFSTVFLAGLPYRWAGLSFDEWAYVGLALFSILIALEVILLAYYWYVSQGGTLTRAAVFTPVSEEKVEAGKPEKEVKEKTMVTFTYPKDVEGGVFTSNYIDVSEDTVLKMRQMLVRACMLCGKRLECWPKYKDKVTRAEFLFNVDCIDGLERLSKEKKKK